MPKHNIFTHNSAYLHTLTKFSITTPHAQLCTRTYASCFVGAYNLVKVHDTQNDKWWRYLDGYTKLGRGGGGKFAEGWPDRHKGCPGMVNQSKQIILN